MKGRFQTPEWLTHDGVMSCERGNDWQLTLDVATDKLQPADLTFYPPRVKSSNESVVSAVVNEDPRSVQIKCASTGRAELTLQVADLVFCMPVVVSDDATARDATPCAQTLPATNVVRSGTLPKKVEQPASVKSIQFVAPTVKILYASEMSSGPKGKTYLVRIKVDSILDADKFVIRIQRTRDCKHNPISGDVREEPANKTASIAFPAAPGEPIVYITVDAVYNADAAKLTIRATALRMMPWASHRTGMPVSNDMRL